MKSLVAVLVLMVGVVVAPPVDATVHTVSPVPGSLTRHMISGIYVAGVSSGGSMAVQIHVAHSAKVKGAAVFAAPPYYCAQDNANQAVYACAAGTAPDYLSTLEADTNTFANNGWIDAPSHLSHAPVFVYHGTNDNTQAGGPVADLRSYYQHFGSTVDYQASTPSGHAWISPYGTVSCGSTASPYINNCGIDSEHEFLTDWFGSVNAPNTGTLTGQLIEFGQDQYSPLGAAYNVAMDSNGFAYVPSACTPSTSCTLLIALHGCLQNHQSVGTAFMDDANLDQYADTNHMIVLYPQTTSAYPGNPGGCWDWWGYLGAGDTAYPIQSGAQLTAIWNMVGALGG